MGCRSAWVRCGSAKVVLVGRFVELGQTGHTGRGAQAALLLQALGDSWDDALLRDAWDQLRGRTPRLDAEQPDEED